MDRIEKFFTEFSEPTLYIVELFLLAAVFFFTLNILRKNNAKLLIVIFVFFIPIAAVIGFNLDAYGDIVTFALIGFFVIFVVSLFSTEIKRAVWTSSLKGGDIKHSDSDSTGEEAKTSIDEIIKAVQSMSKNNVGAIIILANSNMPSAILDSGVTLNSEISSALIESIFFPKTPLHDGAMVINGTKIQAAGCFLPLSQEINLPKELGTRHRAGIGITEAINVTSIIVSEETGVISVAHGGKLRRYADTEMLKHTLKSFYWQDMIK